MIDRIIMHHSIIMYNSKLLYWYKRNKLTYFDYDDDCLNKKECDFKVEIVVGM